jgi:hypothetical protein
LILTAPLSGICAGRPRHAGAQDDLDDDVSESSSSSSSSSSSHSTIHMPFHAIPQAQEPQNLQIGPPEAKQHTAGEAASLLGGPEKHESGTCVCLFLESCVILLESRVSWCICDRQVTGVRPQMQTTIGQKRACTNRCSSTVTLNEASSIERAQQQLKLVTRSTMIGLKRSKQGSSGFRVPSRA